MTTEYSCGTTMSRLWIWVSAKKSFTSPYIRIPKDILEKIKDEGPDIYYVIMTNDKRKVREIVKLLANCECTEHHDKQCKGTNSAQGVYTR